MEELFEDPQFKALDLVESLNHFKAGRIDVLKPPWHLSETPEGASLPPPALGEHTIRVLEENGYTVEEIQSLLAEGVVESCSPF